MARKLLSPGTKELHSPPYTWALGHVDPRLVLSAVSSASLTNTTVQGSNAPAIVCRLGLSRRAAKPYDATFVSALEIGRPLCGCILLFIHPICLFLRPLHVSERDKTTEYPHLLEAPLPAEQDLSTI